MPAKTKNGNPILRISAAIKSKEGCSGDNANEVPAELEGLLQDEMPANVIIPDDAAITTETLRAVLSRNSMTKNILLGVREPVENAK